MVPAARIAFELDFWRIRSGVEAGKLLRAACGTLTLAAAHLELGALHINSPPWAQTPQAPWPRVHRLPSANATLAWSSCTHLAMLPAAGEHTAKRAVEAAPEEVDPAHPPDPQT
jgi:hypothetical protein